MMFRATFVILLVIICSCNEKQSQFPHIIITTNYGKIEAELYPAKAPKTVAAFLSYVEKGYYENITFYRVLKDEEMPTDYNSGLIQGGVWPNLKAVPGIAHESTKQTGLTHTDGTISMARTGVGTATTEFFICIGDQLQFDSNEDANAGQVGYAAFAKVFKGMDVVSNIQNDPSHNDEFKREIKISNIERLQ